MQDLETFQKSCAVWCNAFERHNNVRRVWKIFCNVNKTNCSSQKAKLLLAVRVVKKVGRMGIAFIISIFRLSYTARFSQEHQVCLQSKALVWVLRGTELHGLVFLLRRIESYLPKEILFPERKQLSAIFICVHTMVCTLVPQNMKWDSSEQNGHLTQDDSSYLKWDIFRCQKQ